MGSTGWAVFLYCLGACICISRSSTCSHAQCNYDYVSAKADCSSLNLDCIPDNYPDALIMDLSHNNISELLTDDFNGTFSRLAELYLDYNNISDVTSLLGSNEMGSLQKLSVNHNVIAGVLPYYTCRLSSLTELSVDYNSITYVSDIPRCGALQRFSADFNLIRHFRFDDLSINIITVSIQFNQLSNINVFVHFVRLSNTDSSLLLDHNEITYFSFFNLLGSGAVFDIISLNHNRLQSVSMDGSAPNTFNIGSNRLNNWGTVYVGFGNTVKRVDVSNNSFDSLIQPYWAEGLEFLNADINLLANLSSTTLSGFVSLTELHVANNRLLFISPTALSQLSMLKSLYLDYNALTSLFGGVFFNQSNLVELYITNNLLTVLHPGYFIGLVSLESLYLAGNQITSVNSQMFRLMPGIRTIDLSQNELQLVNLENCALSNLTNLNNLSLAHNMIHDAVTVLGFCDNLQILDMSYNLIQVVPGDSLSGRNKALSKLELEGNPLQCDCRLTGLRDWLRNNPPYVEPRCEGPKHQYGSVVTDLDIRDFSCEPPRATVDKQDLVAVAGQTVTLTCTVTGIPAPTITWLSPNDTEIAHDWQGRFTILQGKILHITPVEKSDQGMYTCLAQNVLDEMSRAVVNLTVTSSKPDPVKPHSLAASVLPTMFITIAVTVAVITVIVWLRRHRKKQHGLTANSSSATKTSDLKVGFRKGDTTGSDRGYVNKAQDEDYEVSSDKQPTRNGYVATPPTGRRQPSQTYAQTYENPSGVNGHDNEDGEVYEKVSVP